ncbi:MAG: peptide transporter [Tenericutes bacterium]|nr:MAG: peptide transporter [Mycoplasmatota bacterium]
MLGIDITKISRFNKPTKAFIKKILHPKEILKYENEEDKSLFLASRWAIKESLYKANNKYFHFNKINIEKKDNKYVFEEFQISTSKEEDYYIAVVTKGK